ncbi:pleckstrin homology domain-containing family A member 5 isoform X6 [Xenopus tropicalis]|uniref:Pleckstrin homology domain-containing family A member 5 isoform X6 n=1 Tax=Xenopus tropicalis TaxID=8364 RepID=A0A8J1J8S9_XENTR|nr:pleckstrin homology domain-containing family A member 5 isoform X6 [Xenopus tropicalis]
MAAPDWLPSLPGSWRFGISRGGRVFFINEEAKSTTWLHPVTGETILTGHRKAPDLPTGWEEGYTFEGARYYINHNERKVTCTHPVTGQPSQDNCIFVVNEQTPSSVSSQEKKDRTVSMSSESPNCNSLPPGNPSSPLTRSSRSSGKIHNFGKRSNSIRRNPGAPVAMRGWLYKKANSGMKLWKKRWFVLSDLCLFYYRDEKEEGVLGSILLPSFQICTVTPEDHINRLFAFKVNLLLCKAAHSNMRTYYFCTDSAPDTEMWMRVMTDASLVRSLPPNRAEPMKCENVAPPELNHVANHRLLIRPEANNNQRNAELSRLGGQKSVEAEKYGFQGQDRPLTKITGGRPGPGMSDYETLQPGLVQYRSAHINGPENQGHFSEPDSADSHRTVAPSTEPERVMQRTNSLLQLGQWIRAQRDKEFEGESRGVMSYQTLPRNMPSHHTPTLPRYPEGYRTLPRQPKARPESLCSAAGYEQSLGPQEKRRSIRDDTMWQLYEWQQRQFYNKQSTLRRHTSLTSPKTMIHISDQTLHSIPMSPSHGSISGYHTYSPHRSYRSEVSSPVQIGDITIDRRHKAYPNKHPFVPDRRSMPAGVSLQPITPQGLQGKTPEELTLLLIKLRRQQAELGSIREYTLAQLLRLKPFCSPKNEILSHHLQRNLIYVDHQMAQEDGRSVGYKFRSEEPDIDAQLSRLCEQDKLVQALEQKLQQLHKEKYTVEQALLSASQEIELNADSPTAMQSVVLQRDDLQNGLLSTCREVSRATAELERSWREYDKLERDVTAARNQMREQLERMGGVQTETGGIQRAQMQKEIWRIQDVMEGLSKHKQHRSQAEAESEPHAVSTGDNEEEVPPRPPLPRSYDLPEGPPAIPPMPSKSSPALLCGNRGPIQLPDDKMAAPQRNGTYCGPDYRLYKSEPELTTVAEVDETNADDKSEAAANLESAATKGSHYPVGVVSPRTKSPPLESTTIASYVTLRKGRKAEPKTERPRSAVEHLCIAEGPRARMTVEEQLERMKKHQQPSLRRKAFSLFGAPEQSPSQSPSFSRDNSLKMIRRREDKIFSNIKDMENAVRENSAQRESPAQEILRLKETATGAEKSDSVSAGDTGSSADAKETPAPGPPALPDPVGSIQSPGDSGQVSPSLSNHKADTSSADEPNEPNEPLAPGILYDFAPEPFKRLASLEAANRSLPDSPTLPASPVQTQLSEGTHFMCV